MPVALPPSAGVGPTWQHSARRLARRQQCRRCFHRPQSTRRDTVGCILLGAGPMVAASTVPPRSALGTSRPSQTCSRTGRERMRQNQCLGRNSRQHRLRRQRPPHRSCLPSSRKRHPDRFCVSSLLLSRQRSAGLPSNVFRRWSRIGRGICLCQTSRPCRKTQQRFYRRISSGLRRGHSSCTAG